MAGLREISDQKLKTTVIDMVRTLLDIVYHMQEQRGNVSRWKFYKRTKKKCWVPKILTEVGHW
jgi:hypothetical protein